LESLDPARAITTSVLASELQTSEGFVRKIIADLNKGREPVIVGQSFFSTAVKRGRPRVTYRLNRSQLVTIPTTARMLLDLIKFPPDSAYRINRGKYEEHVVNTCGLNAAQVRLILEKAISFGYIESTSEDDIYPSPRIRCEELYLELIASEEDFGKPKSKHTQELGR
jgi:hypothetical protein